NSERYPRSLSPSRYPADSKRLAVDARATEFAPWPHHGRGHDGCDVRRCRCDVSDLTQGSGGRCTATANRCLRGPANLEVKVRSRRVDLLGQIGLDLFRIQGLQHRPQLWIIRHLQAEAGIESGHEVQRFGDLL